MIVRTAEELEGMRRVGALVAETIRRMREAVRPGVTTAELDLIAARTFHEYGALSGPMETYSFPGSTCISVNEEVVHGIGGPRRIQPGDVVKIDVEGRELDVILGAEQTLKRLSPKLLIENHEDIEPGYGSSWSKIVGFLALAGYEPQWELTHNGKPLNVLFEKP